MMSLSVTQQPCEVGRHPTCFIGGREGFCGVDLSELGFGFRYAVLGGLYNHIFSVFLRNHEDRLADVMLT